MLTALVLLVIAYWFFRSPLCGAFAVQVRRHGSAAGVDPLLEERLDEALERLTELSEEMGALRGDVVELAERVDFSERALISVRQQERLPAS